MTEQQTPVVVPPVDVPVWIGTPPPTPTTASSRVNPNPAPSAMSAAVDYATVKAWPFEEARKVAARVAASGSRSAELTKAITSGELFTCKSLGLPADATPRSTGTCRVPMA